MAKDNSQKGLGFDDRSDMVAGIANTLEWLITAFILAFTFRAFVMEAFRIPTGSMADTLKGAHFRLCCPQCGYRYDYDFNGNQVPRYEVSVSQPPRCPSCGYFLPETTRRPVANGDRILVLKCIYQVFEPKRWDVIVFKNPGEPRINYIKRLIGRPGETVEIIDGDIYIDGQIARKPPKVQEELWLPVYDNDYQPVRPGERRFNGHKWQQPFQNKPGSNWKFSGKRNWGRGFAVEGSEDDPTVFTLDSSFEDMHFMFYNTDIGNDFRAAYAYDPPAMYGALPYCSDLMVRFYFSSAGKQGSIGIGLSKYQIHYKAVVDLTGEMFIAVSRAGVEPVKLAQKSILPELTGKPIYTSFANVDHKLIFRFGRDELVYDLGRGPKAAGTPVNSAEPQLNIFGSGTISLSHLAVFRDIHYTSRTFNGRAGNAAVNRPFVLEADEFFALGDNSPASYDCRFWFNEGFGNNDTLYRAGIVPRDYLVGKAVFVYWPSGFKPFRDFPVAFIPSVGRLRFIYGGSNSVF